MRSLTLLLMCGLFSIAYSTYAILKDYKMIIFDPAAIAASYEVINSTFLNLNLTIIKIYNTRVLATLRIKRSANGKIKSVLNWKHVDFCKFLEMYEKDKMLNIIFSKLFQPSYIKSCPLKEGFYYMKHAYFDNAMFRMILPRGLYFFTLDVVMLTDGIERVLSTQIKFVLI